LKQRDSGRNISDKILITFCDGVGWKIANSIQEARLGGAENSLNIAALVDTETFAPACKSLSLFCRIFLPIKARQIQLW